MNFGPIRHNWMFFPGLALALLAPASASVTVSPATLSFAKLPLGETSPLQTVTLTNNQSAILTLHNIFAGGDFAIASKTCGADLAAHASCKVAVTFTPKAIGTRTGTLSFSDNAANSPQTVSLKGTGGAAALLSIAVTPSKPVIYFLGATVQLTATGTYSNNTTKDLSGTATWTSVPSGIASISASGLATATGQGTTAVTATQGSVSGSTELTVDQSFFPTASMNSPRYYHSATVLDTGMVLVAGGIGPISGGTGALGELTSAELYNPAAGVFIPTGSLSTPRDEHTATLLNNGTVLIAGGSNRTGELASAEVYNPTTAHFYAASNLNTARYGHTATMLPNGTVLIAGGYGSGGVLASAEIFNPVNGKFTLTGSLNSARFAATATLLPDSTVLIAGGADSSGTLSSAEIYNSSTGTFTPATFGLQVARSGATATLLNTGQVLFANGYNFLLGGPLTSAELYDPTAGTFTLTGSLTTSAWLGTATLLTNGTVLMAGSAYNTSGAELYSPFSGTFAVTSPLHTPRDLQTAAVLPNGAVLMAGGFSGTTNAVLDAAEVYEPATLAPTNLVSISVTPPNPILAAGASQQFIATGTFSNDTTQQLESVVWSSSNIAVATITGDVSNSGVAYGVAAGTAVLSACTGAVCGTTRLTVAGAASIRP